MGEIFRQERSPEALSEPPDARIARLHRYYLARRFAAGRRVIDLDGGDGSGPALLAQVAAGVVAGLDDPAAVDAAAAAFPAANLQFCLAGQAAAPERPAADLVLAWGLLARQPDPAGFLARLRALLGQGGRLMLDAPARARTGADMAAIRHAFTPVELVALVAGAFAHVRMLSQQGLIGSALLVEGGAAAAPAIYAHRDRLSVERTSGLPDPQGHVCIASDGPLDDVPDSLLIDSGIDALADARARAVQAGAELAALRRDHAELAAQTTERRRSDAEWRHQLAVLRVSEAAAGARAAALAAQRDAIVQTSMAMITRVQEIERATARRAEALEAERDRLQARLDRPPPPSAPWRQRARRLLPGGGRLRVVQASPLFDSDWYLARYPDIGAAGLDPALHYLRHGAAEARDPGPELSAAWYLAQHPDAAGSGLSAVEHYERHGRAAGWPTRPAVAPPAPAPPARPANPKVLFVAGEADTPGSQYRCVRYAEAAREAGWSAGWSRIEETGAIELIGVEVAVLWRVRWSPHVEGVMREIHNAGGIVVFDVDDLMIRPELARTSIIDGIRTTNAGIGSTRETFAQVQQAMLHADLCTTTTEELAQHMRAWQKATYILPNGFDDATLEVARLAVRRRALAPADGLVRIGYAAGTLTHQKDFSVALPGLVQVLRARPQVRVVLFRAKDGPDLVVVDEFDALLPFAARIEWRDKVELEALPAEIARFDINIAPLELGNPFCEAKSELKYFEAALVNVPTVASPTGPFARTIVHQQTGMLAADDEAWHQSLLRLVDDVELRHAIGRRAYLACIWPFGPRRRADLVDGFLQQIGGTLAGARAFARDVLSARAPAAAGAMALPPAHLLYRIDRLRQAAVTVVVPCYNYAEFIIEALESVRAQTLDCLDLVVVDDGSTDPLTTELIGQWARQHESRFNRLLVLRHAANAGLSAARNTGFDAAETPFVLPLDADNRLRPECCEALLATLRASRAAYAYPSVQMFGADDAVFCNERYQPMRLVGGNYIDAMAMIGKWAWAAAGGYDMPRSMGWEDFDLWCRLAELGQRGVHLDRILAEYRVHGGSMVSNVVEVAANKERMVALIEQRHPWLRLSSRTVHERV